jgi:hypothetical protein
MNRSCLFSQRLRQIADRLTSVPLALLIFLGVLEKPIGQRRNIGVIDRRIIDRLKCGPICPIDIV